MGDTTLPGRVAGEPEGRYGRRRARNRVAPILVVGVLAIGGLAWLFWAALANANQPVRAGLVTYDVTSDRSVEVRFEVQKRDAVPATCVIRARNREGVEVGRKEVTVSADTRHAVLTEVVETSDRPVTGELEGCRVADREH